MDDNYVGIERVLTAWAPLLAESHSAAIVGYFMNWPFSQPDGDVTHAGEEVNRKFFNRMVEEGLVSTPGFSDRCVY